MDLCLEIGVTRHALSRLERVLGTYPENKEKVIEELNTLKEYYANIKKCRDFIEAIYVGTPEIGGVFAVRDIEKEKQIIKGRATTFLTTYFYGKETAKVSFYILPY